MGAALAFIVSPLGKIAGIALLVLALLGTGVILLKQHDGRVLAEQNLVVQKAQAAEQAAAAARTIATLQTENQQAMADLASASAVKGSIARAKNTNACIDSPAIGAALLGLQPASGGHAAQGKAAR